MPGLGCTLLKDKACILFCVDWHLCTHTLKIMIEQIGKHSSLGPLAHFNEHAHNTMRRATSCHLIHSVYRVQLTTITFWLGNIYNIAYLHEA